MAGRRIVAPRLPNPPPGASPHGSQLKIVTHQETGFTVDDLDGAVAAVGLLGEISRERARRHVEERFSRERMAENYIKVYEQVLGMVEEKAR